MSIPEPVLPAGTGPNLGPDLVYGSISELAPLVETGELSPVELVEASLARISQLDRGPQGLNAFLGV